jgi:hypothetical protein
MVPPLDHRQSWPRLYHTTNWHLGRGNPHSQMDRLELVCLKILVHFKLNLISFLIPDSKFIQTDPWVCHFEWKKWPLCHWGPSPGHSHAHWVCWNSILVNSVNQNGVDFR